MKTTVSVTGLAEAVQGSEADLAATVTDAMRSATDTLKATLREQVTGAGMGQRLANTWRANTYPSEQVSLGPAGYAWSQAPDIITAFSSGATIRPLNGKAYLWLPSKNVPRARVTGRASSKKKMTPEQVLADFHVKEFVIKNGKRGAKLAFIVQGRGTTKRGAVRRVTRGRLAHGDSGQLLLMFILVTSVTPKQVLDLDAAADAGASDFIDRLNEGTRG